MKTRKQKTPVRKRAQRRPAAVRKTSAPAAGTATTLALAAECTVAGADSLKTGLARLLGDSRPVTLDVGAVQRIDTTGLQLLAAFMRDRRASGRQVQWRGRAPALDTAARLLGLRSMLELPGGEDR